MWNLIIMQRRSLIMKKIKFNTPEELIEDIRMGKMVVLVDDEDRENEGDLVLAADHVKPDLINFMAKEARGLICLALSAEQIEKLKLPLMVREDQNHSPNNTAFTVSIEASTGVSTGISAADRAHTVWVASRPTAKPTDVHTPGHIFPIRAQNGGVLKRAGHTEGSVDLARLAGLNPAAVICEVMKEDGTMARVPDLFQFAEKHHLKIGTIVDLIEYRLQRDQLVEEIFSKEVSELLGGVTLRVFKSRVDGMEHLVLQKGSLPADQTVSVRVHLDSFSREFFQLLIHKSKEQAGTTLPAVLKKLEQVDTGVLLLLRGNNKATGLVSEICEFLGESVPSEMDLRDYGIGAQILRQMGIHKVSLISNRVDKRVGLKAYGIEIVSSEPI